MAKWQYGFFQKKIKENLQERCQEGCNWTQPHQVAADNVQNNPKGGNPGGTAEDSWVQLIAELGQLHAYQDAGGHHS